MVGVDGAARLRMGCRSLPPPALTVHGPALPPRRRCIVCGARDCKLACALGARWRGDRHARGNGSTSRRSRSLGKIELSSIGNTDLRGVVSGGHDSSAARCMPDCVRRAFRWQQRGAPVQADLHTCRALGASMPRRRRAWSGQRPRSFASASRRRLVSMASCIAFWMTAASLPLRNQSSHPSLSAISPVVPLV